MASEIATQLEKLKDPSILSAVKHRIVNEVTRKLKNNEYSPDQMMSHFTDAKTLREPFVRSVFVNFLNVTHNDDVMISTLLSEHELLIDEVIKHCDFFWGDVRHSMEFYVEKIFTKVSYSQRNRILKAIAKNTFDQDRARFFYNQLADTYNMQTARIFLKKCSLVHWIEVIEHNVILTQDELLETLKKQRRSKDVCDYLEHLMAMQETNKKLDFDKDNYRDVFEQIFHCYPQKVLKLMRSQIDGEDRPHSIYKASRKVTKKMLRDFPDYVISDSNHSSYNMDVLLKYFSPEQLELYIMNLYPKDYERVYDITYVDWRVATIFRKISDKKKRFNLMVNCYRRCYNRDPLLPKLMIHNVMEMMVDNDLRHRIAMEKFTNDTANTDNWIKYMKTEVAIPKLKELIRSSAKADVRKKYICDLIKTCRINNDSAMLLSVLKYFNEKHKNEQLPVRNAFVEAFLENFKHQLIKMENRQEYLEELYKIVHMFDIKSELGQVSTDNIFAPALQASLNDKATFSKWFMLFQNWCNANVYRFRNAIQLALTVRGNQNFLLWIAEIVLEKFDDEVFDYILRFNDKYPAKRIEILHNEWCVKYVTKKIQQGCDVKAERYYIFKIVRLLEKDADVAKHFAESIIKMKKIVLHKCDKIEDLDDILELMSVDMDYVAKISSKLLDSLLEFFKSEDNGQKVRVEKIEKSKKLPGFEQMLYDKCYQILLDKRTDQLKADALCILLSTISVDLFFQIAEPYYPVDKDAETGSDEAKYKFAMQKRIACSLPHFKSEPQALVALKRFCFGDFLQLTVGSLNSICQKLPHQKTKAFLDGCIKSPVSFKKHILRLLQLIVTKKQLIDLLQAAGQNEKNSSIRKILLDKTFAYFLTEPNKSVWWAMMEQWIAKLDQNDKDILETMVQRQDEVPKEYFSVYCKLIWEKNAEIEKECPQFKENRLSMLHSIEYNLKVVDTKLIDYILQNLSFEIANTTLSQKYLQISVGYMFLEQGTESERQRRTEDIMTKMKQAFVCSWDKVDDDDEYPTRNIISEYIYKVLRQALWLLESENTRSIMAYFGQQLKTIFDPQIHFYSHYLTLELVLIYLDVSGDLFEFGKQIRNTIDREFSKYGSITAISFASQLYSFTQMLRDSEKLSPIVDGLLCAPLQSPDCGLTAHFFVNHLFRSDKKQKTKYGKLLLQTNDERIKLFSKNRIEILD